MEVFGRLFIILRRFITFLDVFGRFKTFFDVFGGFQMFWMFWDVLGLFLYCFGKSWDVFFLLLYLCTVVLL